MNWTDITIKTKKAFAETVQTAASSICVGGIYIEDYSDLESEVMEIAHIDIIDDELLQKDRDEVLVHMYIQDNENVASIIELLHERMAHAEIEYTITSSGVKQEDWESGWKAYYHPIEIGERLAIVPSWESFETERTVITLDPGMAFGTGTHETTALCLQTLDEIIKGGERVLDIGTGSGILAIAALKLGAKTAHAVDNDPMCVKTAIENAELNGVTKACDVLLGDLSQTASGTYDVICANIVANAIISLSPSIPALLAKNGIFLASGIIDTRQDEVVTALTNAGLVIERVLLQNGWIAIMSKSTMV